MTRSGHTFVSSACLVFCTVLLAQTSPLQGCLNEKLQVGPPETASLWKPIPPTGQVPPIFDSQRVPPPPSSSDLVKIRDYERTLRQIRNRCFIRTRSESLRTQGIHQLREISDPLAFLPMIDVFAKDQDDIRLAMLDHCAAHGEAGQAALAHAAIYLRDRALAHEAELRMTKPVRHPALAVFDRALRSSDHAIANAAASLAGAMNILETIPLLIFAQASTTSNNAGQTGDLAWIAIETQRAYVQALTPVVGAGSAAFAPVLGTISDGSVLRIQDAVVITYRTIVHQVLVTMTTLDWGRPTEHLNYSVNGWWTWYNESYVPFKNDQAALSELMSQGSNAGTTSSRSSPSQ